MRRERWKRRVRRRAFGPRAERLAEDDGAMGAGWGDWGEFLRFLDKGLEGNARRRCVADKKV